jgi:hypothetical protein
MRDFQRSRLYAWERSLSIWWPAADDATPRTMTLAECSRLVERATRRYGVATPPIADGRGTRFAKGSSWRISLPTWARNLAVVLHETAHCIDAARDVDDRHGPVFVRLYIQLLATYAGQNEAMLVKSARAAGLKVAGRQRVRI